MRATPCACVYRRFLSTPCIYIYIVAHSRRSFFVVFARCSRPTWSRDKRTATVRKFIAFRNHRSPSPPLLQPPVVLRRRFSLAVRLNRNTPRVAIRPTVVHARVRRRTIIVGFRRTCREHAPLATIIRETSRRAGLRNR